MTRQLQGLRYYHDAWRKVMLFGVFSGLIVLANIVCAWVAFAPSDLLSTSLTLGAVATFGIVCGWLMHRTERRVNHYLGNRAVGGFSLPWMLILAAPLAQIVHSVALFRAYALRDVTWRGIRYEARSGLDVSRTNYAPYVSESKAVQHSL